MVADTAVGGGTVDAVNRLTARWADATTGGTVFSAAGVWPLLAFLADGAAGAARAELSDAMGVAADQAGAAARELSALMRAMPGLNSALGLWTRRELAVREEWLAGLPADTHGVLTEDLPGSQRALDAWAAERTDGLVERMPVALDQDVLMVLASALALRTEWPRPFSELMLRPDAGPWQGRQLTGLRRTGVRLDRAGVASGPRGRVTEVKVPGDNGIDVHLLLGEQRMTPGQVLGRGVDVLARRLPVVASGQLPHGDVGPGLRVEQHRCAAPQQPELTVTTVAYDMRARHDLRELHGLFGLTTAMDSRGGHFPGISPSPLAVGQAEQSAVAQFGALGFRAGAVTAIAPGPGGSRPDLRHTTTVVTARFDRPFGFLAVHRESRLVLTAGWVTDPTPYRR
ncbi:proteinase inhibitor I4 serpin [Streptomyces sp. MBT65]|uniref:serpin family protein n=1 Tax=Streptomyces sp. MBT65 TaxID=1488395 RepID=UPI00190DCBA9|nr:serpin family protein [Streptomyces sp. MBT65]MBK3581753.1 proteinase inhibitor I4 serpin [Streptomyces sp. MBT65]